MSNCPICGDAGGSIMGPYRHRHPIFGGLSRAYCLSCQMIFATPMPGEAALAAYNASYFDSAHGGAPIDSIAIAFHSGINRLRVAHVERFLYTRKVSVSSVLEVGAGGGYFARHWLARHPESRYQAVESDTSCHPGLLAMGVEVLQEARDTLQPPLDLVVMSHVLEHTSGPSDFLRGMTARLRHGGALFIEVPCRDWEFKSEDEPHLLFFDKLPMARLLNDLGFAEIQLTYHGREIATLRSPSLVARVLGRVRAGLLRRGVVAPFARITPGLEILNEPLERAAVAPYEAQLERSNPAWWLRATAQKS